MQLNSGSVLFVELNTIPESVESRPKPERFYRPEFDILRLFAFLCVYLHHSLQQHYGRNFELAQNGVIPMAGVAAASGLPLFFFLSAYLITELLFRECDSTGTIHLKQFYVRRALRIWPLYYLGIAIGIVNAIFVPGRLFAPWQIVCMCLFLGWYRRNTYVNEVDILFSISIEELFYLVWPTVIKFGGREGVLWACCGLIPVALTAATLFPDSWFNPLVQSLFFAGGALAAIYFRGKPLSLSPVRRLALFAGGVLGWLCSTQVREGAGAVYLLMGIGCALIFVSVLGISERYLPKALVYLGKVSYGLYVFHVFSIEAVRLAVARRELWSIPTSEFVLLDIGALALTMGLAIFSYQYFEMPFLRFKEKFTFIRSGAV